MTDLKRMNGLLCHIHVETNLPEGQFMISELACTDDMDDSVNV